MSAVLTTVLEAQNKSSSPHVHMASQKRGIVHTYSKAQLYVRALVVADGESGTYTCTYTCRGYGCHTEQKFYQCKTSQNCLLTLQKKNLRFQFSIFFLRELHPHTLIDQLHSTAACMVSQYVCPFKLSQFLSPNLSANMCNFCTIQKFFRYMIFKVITYL